MLLDSSVLVAYFNSEDTHHVNARLLMDGLHRWIILYEIFFETITVLQMKVSKSVAHNACSFLLEDSRTQIIQHTGSDFHMASQYFLSQKGSLTIYDMLFVAVAENHSLQLLSFDAKLTHYFNGRKFHE